MPLKPKTIEKLYWTIGEVADELGVNNSTIRFWEKEFDLSAARRTGKGDRLYTRKEIDHLRTIQHLVKDKGFTLQGARTQLKQGLPDAQPQQPDHLREVAERLSVLRAKLLTLRGELGPAARKGASAD